MELTPAEFGRPLWNLLHRQARFCITDEKIDHFISFTEDFIDFLPCQDCRDHAIEFYREHPPQQYVHIVNSEGVKVGMFVWSVEFHNHANRITHAPQVKWNDVYDFYGKIPTPTFSRHPPKSPTPHVQNNPKVAPHIKANIASNKVSQILPNKNKLTNFVSPSPQKVDNLNKVTTLPQKVDNLNKVTALPQKVDNLNKVTALPQKVDNLNKVLPQKVDNLNKFTTLPQKVDNLNKVIAITQKVDHLAPKMGLVMNKPLTVNAIKTGLKPINYQPAKQGENPIRVNRMTTSDHAASCTHKPNEMIKLIGVTQPQKAGCPCQKKPVTF